MNCGAGSGVVARGDVGLGGGLRVGERLGVRPRLGASGDARLS